MLISFSLKTKRKIALVESLLMLWNYLCNSNFCRTLYEPRVFHFDIHLLNINYG